MEQRALGHSGLTVSALGLGTLGLGGAQVMEADFARTLHQAIDQGVTLIDTARSYGFAEQRLGRHLGARREQVVLCTKGGYGVEGVPDWTTEAVSLGIHRALRQLRTDRLDLFLLHSCPLDVLQDEEVLAVLASAKAAGKIRVAGYAGEGEALAWAIDSGHFGTVECSVNLVDRRNLNTLIPRAVARGVGVLAKRPLCSGALNHDLAPSASDVAIYWGRLQRLELPDDPALPRDALALRFAAHAKGVTSALAGCRSSLHLQRNLDAVEAGPLDAARLATLEQAYAGVGADWDGII
jgi:aryl-alcohol dehydrogenase-like predicted oxidoreductase